MSPTVESLFYPFPKISGKHHDFLRQLRLLKEAGFLPSKLSIEGTVKLHGMHADIVFDLNHLQYTSIAHARRENLRTSQEMVPKNEETTNSLMRDLHKLQIYDAEDNMLTTISFQSRNRICLPTEDVQGWPCNLAIRPAALLRLRNRILGRYLSLHSHDKASSNNTFSSVLDTTQPLIIAGEWIGSRIQRDVGISALTPRFVVLSININGVWQHDSDYADIEACEAGIYSVHRAPQYKVEWNTEDISDRNPTLLEMQKLADEVEACCPFAKHFRVGVERISGASTSHQEMDTTETSIEFGGEDSREKLRNAKLRTLSAVNLSNAQKRMKWRNVEESSIAGEGIVWKPGVPEGRRNPACWFKTKGPRLGGDNHINSLSLALSSSKRQSIDEACCKWISDRRVEQGFEYLMEMGIEPGPQAIKEFLKWMVQDVEAEEKTEIEMLRESSDIVDDKSEEREERENTGEGNAGSRLTGKMKTRVCRIAKLRYLQSMRECR